MNQLLPFEYERASDVQSAVDALAQDGNAEERGAVFTRSEIVEGILDLCGYVEERALTRMRLLEPSAGEGAFLVPAVVRLLRSCARDLGPPAEHVAALEPCIRAVELHRATCETTRAELAVLLRAHGLEADDARELAAAWLVQDDFLLTELEGGFDVAIGNPPYVRQERIPELLLREYKRRYETLYDRADLYVPFYERCLDLLKPGGVLGFICANRWVKNKYGAVLREKVARSFHLDIYVDLSHADAFHGAVDAYPAITIIRSAAPQETRVVTAGRFGEVSATEVFKRLADARPDSCSDRGISMVQRVGRGRDPWLVDAPEILDVVRRMERCFPTLEESGARVGIGVATGADRVFIGRFDELPVESERRLRLVMSSDLRRTGVEWSGLGLVNPWLEHGGLAALEAHPRFAAYLREHEPTLRARHTARKSPHAWYKTIDRVHPGLAETPKLLIPDIKGEAMIVYDKGEYYPHHNLYVVTSDAWDLRALQTVLRSSVALMFVAAYCVRMAGGFLRFQAQYLRRIRVPSPAALDETCCRELAALAEAPCQREIDRAVFAAYGISTIEAERIASFAAAARVPTKESQ